MASKYNLEILSFMLARIPKVRDIVAGVLALAAAAIGSATPLLKAKELICFCNFLFPHFGQTGARSGLIRFDKKL